MKPSCPRCGLPLDPEGVCASCAYAGVFDDQVASAFPLEQEEAAERISKRRGLVDLEPLGRGGMGFVYRARQVQLDREVALKLFAAGSPERFEREARVLASLSHPNLVAIHDFGMEEGLPYFVMEFMDGPSLRTIIDMGDLSPRRALEILEQIGRALEYAHARGIIHRDIKPENILTSVDGHVKVGDFGIARLADQEGDAGGGSGTPEYMAPERLHIPGAADERSDIYSLGALAREMLPGSGDDRLHEIVRRALDPDPARRFQTVTEFLAALRGVSTPETTPPRLSFNVRWRRLALSRLFWFFLATSSLELFILGCMLYTSPPDPRLAFERLTRYPRHDMFALSDLQAKLPPAEVDALLVREAAGPDARRAETALNAALSLGRRRLIPPDLRIRIMNQSWGNPPDPGWNVDFRNPHYGVEAYLEAIREGGSRLARQQYEELASGQCPENRRDLAVLGIAVAGDGELMLEMRRRLLADPPPPNAYHILCALAARTDSPLPENEQDVPIFIRHLPNLLDPETGEARWEAAVRLALDLPKGKNRGRWESDYIPYKPDKDDLRPELLLTYKKHLTWPLDEKAARNLRQQLRNPNSVGSAYLAAVLLRWRETGRLNLPLYPYGSNSYYHVLSFGLMRALDRNRFETDVRAILPSSTEEVTWQCFYLAVPTLASRFQLLATGYGKNRVDFSASYDVPKPGQPSMLHFGVGNLVPRPPKSNLRTGAVTLKGKFETREDGTLDFKGSDSVRDSFGGGSGSAHGRGRPGEAMVLQCSVFNAHGRDLRSGYAWILVPDPTPAADPESRWRLAIREGLKRHSVGPAGFLEKHDVGRLVSVAIWTPIPEAVDGLRELWKRRAEFKDDRTPDLMSLPISDSIGAALLMAGDAAPLEEAGFLDRLKTDLHTRLFLFCPNPTIRAAVEQRAVQTMGRLDAEETARVLLERGDTTSPLATAAARAVSQGRRDQFLEMLPYLGGALVIVLFGWFPRSRGYLPAIAGSLAFTGLALHLLKFEFGGRIWIPVAGDLLLMIAAFMYGGRALRVLTTALVLCGILQLMIPESAALGMSIVLLICAYLAVMTLDGLVRWLPARISRRHGLAFLSTWWMIIIPCVVLSLAGLFYLPASAVTAEFIKVTGVPIIPFALALVIPPLWLARHERRRRLGEAAQMLRA